jgi:hypothetical protein
MFYEYAQLFDFLELDFLPGEEDDYEIKENAVEEYYKYLICFPFEYFDTSPELQRGCNAIRKLLSDLGEANITEADKVWKVIATCENWTLLGFTDKLLRWMWN